MEKKVYHSNKNVCSKFRNNRLSTNLNRFGSSLPEDVHGGSSSWLHLYDVQQVLQDVEQLFETQMRATAVQVSVVPVRRVQGLHPTCSSSRTTFQANLTEHLRYHNIEYIRYRTKKDPSHCMFFLPPITKKPFPCRHCDRSYKNKSSLNRHIQYECGKEKQFICPICQRRMIQKSSLHKHMVAVHGI
ncbi:hypothetical protein HZH68_012355 [Vespula germanica]|uniref:C2H2-type domain-containing protein n=1 Tax=Vespula germanica TaxID=30212 RepID=A0A834MZ87_VESGE|nr:hypothetical protein HZH68_012355 [Vespula germanica]